MKKKSATKYNHWSLLLVCLFLYSCSFMPDKLKIAEQLIETAPDSALHILQQVYTGKFSCEEDRALYGLLLFRILDKKYLPLKPDSAIEFSLSYYQIHHDDIRLAYCYLYKGRANKYALQYENAMNCYLKALDVAQLKNDYLLLGRINSDIGDIHNAQRDYGLARQKYKLALNYFSRAKLQSLAFNSFLGIGRSYRAAGNYRKAQLHYRKVFPLAQDSIQRGALLQEIAINYYNNKQYDSALVYFRQVIPYPYVRNNRAIRYYYLADLFFDLNQIDSAGYYAGNSFRYSPDIRTQRECYRILANVSYVKKDIKEISGYINKYIELSSSIRKIDEQTKGSILETMHSKTKEVLNTKLQRLYLLASILVLILVGLIIFCVWKRYYKQERCKMEEKHLQQKIETRRKLIKRQRDTLMQKVEVMKAIQTDERKKSKPEAKAEMDRQIYNIVLHLTDREFFEREMDILLNNLVSKLKTRYSSLTVKEITWCCLHMLDIPITDVLLLLDYKVDSLNKMKQRLAQKTNLTNAAELNCFLNRILAEE